MITPGYGGCLCHDCQGLFVVTKELQAPFDRELESPETFIILCSHGKPI